MGTLASHVSQSTLRSKSVKTWRLASVSSRSGTTSKDLLRNLITAPPVVDLLAGLQEIETPELKRESSGIQNQRTASQSQETKGHDHGIEDQDQNTGSHAQGRGGQGRGTEDQGLRTVNQDTGLGQGTSPGTGEIGQGRGRRKRKRKGTDLAPETGITRNTRKIGHARGEDQHQDPGLEKASRRAKMTTTVRN